MLIRLYHPGQSNQNSPDQSRLCLTWSGSPVEIAWTQEVTCVTCVCTLHARALLFKLGGVNLNYNSEVHSLFSAEEIGAS